eukprot:2376974-Ditylum_brightwellii.AAC.1
MNEVTKAIYKFPSWYNDVDPNSPAGECWVKGQAIIEELNNIHKIFSSHLSTLSKQAGHNFFAQTRPEGRKPNSSNVSFVIVKTAPKQVDWSRRTVSIQATYDGVD